MTPMRARDDRRAVRKREGFTLIEMMAVVAIIVMVFSIGIPMLGGSDWDPLEDEAETLAERMRFARQRAIMTGIPHRVFVDLEDGFYRVEWYVSETRAAGGGGGGGLDFGALLGIDAGGDAGDSEALLDFVPASREERAYYPIPSREMGSDRWLDEALYFVGVDGSSGWVESGDYSIVFYVDGTTDPALLELADADDNHLTLEIEPILDRVRVRAGGARS